MCVCVCGYVTSFLSLIHPNCIRTRFVRLYLENEQALNSRRFVNIADLRAFRPADFSEINLSLSLEDTSDNKLPVSFRRMPLIRKCRLLSYNAYRFHKGASFSRSAREARELASLALMKHIF